MFKREWWDVNNPGRGIMVDEYSRTYVNVTCKLKSNEPFVLACQVEQVFYIKDIYKESFLAVCSKDRASKLLQYAASRRGKGWKRRCSRTIPTKCFTLSSIGFYKWFGQ